MTYNTMDNYGVLLGQRPEDFMAGATNALPFVVRNPSGDWRQWLPTPEVQKSNYADSMACVTYSALNCVETQYKHQTGKEVNFSDRYIAKVSNTQTTGNYLYRVADALRLGLVLDADYPAPAGFTWDTYYAEIPQAVHDKKRVYAIAYEWVPATKADILHHLQHAPIQLALHNPAHAVAGVYCEEDVARYFDSYKPHNKTTPYTNVAAAMKIVLTLDDNMNDAQLNKLWLAAFKRPIDPAGLAFWRGKTFDEVVAGVLASPEHKHYEPVYQAVKALEGSLRRQEW